MSLLKFTFTPERRAFPAVKALMVMVELFELSVFIDRGDAVISSAAASSDVPTTLVIVIDCVALRALTVIVSCNCAVGLVVPAV